MGNQSLHEKLQKLVESCDGAIAGVVMGFDGVTVESYTRDKQLDINSISMEFAFVLSQVRKAAEILDVGPLKEVSIGSETLTFIIRVLNNYYFLGLAMTPNGNFGKGRYQMRMVQSDFNTER